MNKEKGINKGDLNIIKKEKEKGLILLIFNINL